MKGRGGRTGRLLALQEGVFCAESNAFNAKFYVLIKLEDANHIDRADYSTKVVSDLATG
jgi:hypothetical protein